MKVIKFIKEKVVSDTTWSSQFVLREFILKSRYWQTPGKSKICLSIHDAIDSAEISLSGKFKITDEEREELLNAARAFDLNAISASFTRYYLQVLDSIESATKEEDS